MIIELMIVSLVLALVAVIFAAPFVFVAWRWDRAHAVWLATLALLLAAGWGYQLAFGPPQPLEEDWPGHILLVVGSFEFILSAAFSLIYLQLREGGRGLTALDRRRDDARQRDYFGLDF